MPDFDNRNDYTPKLANKPPVGPTVANLRSALTTYSGTSYPAAVTRGMTYNDAIYAAKLHGLSVPGL